MSEDMVREIMSRYGEYSLVTTQYDRYKADTKRNHTSDFSVEYLHILHKPRANSIFTKKGEYNVLNDSIKELFISERDPRKMSRLMLELNKEDWISIFSNSKLPIHIIDHIEKYFKVTKNENLKFIMKSLLKDGFDKPLFLKSISYLKTFDNEDI